MQIVPGENHSPFSFLNAFEESGLSKAGIYPAYKLKELGFDPVSLANDKNYAPYCQKIGQTDNFDFNLKEIKLFLLFKSQWFSIAGSHKDILVLPCSSNFFDLFTQARGLASRLLQLDNGRWAYTNDSEIIGGNEQIAKNIASRYKKEMAEILKSVPNLMAQLASVYRSENLPKEYWAPINEELEHLTKDY